VALARALLGHPRILVLDDPMSALDVRTEEAIERGLRWAVAGVTVLVVARRPSTALLADRVAVLDAGHIVDVGTHAELMKRSATYRHVLVSAKPAGHRSAAEATDG
jgi:ATP-binding cassette subfamily B protein